MEKIRFANYLKDYLEFNNITNKDFANRIGITPKHLIDILSGKRDLSSQIIDSISIVTNIPADYIYKMELNYKIESDIDEYLKNNNLTISQYLNKFSYQYFLFHTFQFFDSMFLDNIFQAITIIILAYHFYFYNKYSYLSHIFFVDLSL